MTLKRHLQALAVDLVTVLEQLDAPVGLTDATGVVLWQNDASLAFFGDLRGTRFGGIPPGFRHQVQTRLARKSMGLDQLSRSGLVLAGADGDLQRVETIGISLMDGDRFVGILGMAHPVAAGGASNSHTTLTPRMLETLRLLADGLSTDEIADTLGVARETARNYIRRLLRALGVHSRLEAVVRGRETGLI
jgi:DNA-binding CsgD family transcriptional regulator